MKAVQVSGRFVHEDGSPCAGPIEFIPSKLWIDDGDESYATLAYYGELVNGSFLVYLSRTDTAELPWHYTVKCPVGEWTIHVTEDGPLSLKSLLPSRFNT